MIRFRLHLCLALALLLALSNCTIAEFQAANDALERQMNQYPGGALGWGVDAFVLSQQIHALRNW
jgi:hypothetical protein